VLMVTLTAGVLWPLMGFDGLPLLGG